MDWPPIAGDPRFFRRSGPHSLAAVADAAQCSAPPLRLMLSGIAPLQTAEASDVSFFDNRKYAEALAATRAGAVIVHPDMQARVPASDHPPLTASLNEDPAPFVCPKKVICRNGAWVHADIGDGRAFSPALEFELHWSKALVPKQQTVKNLAVLKTKCLAGCGDPIVISRRCSSSNPAPGELPCLSGVEETATEFRATLHSSENGYMR